MVTGHVDLLRHGRTLQGNILRGRTDDPLSEEGRSQMWAAVEGQTWDRVVTSPLSRCRVFAEELCHRTRASLTVDERLMEYHFGEWDGQDLDALRSADGERLARFFADPVANTPPGGEDFSRFNDRVLEAWRAIGDHVGGGSTLVITHGGVILSVLAAVLGRERLHGRVDVPYACISRISRGGTDHLPRLLYHGHGPIRSN